MAGEDFYLRGGEKKKVGALRLLVLLNVERVNLGGNFVVLKVNVLRDKAIDRLELERKVGSKDFAEPGVAVDVHAHILKLDRESLRLERVERSAGGRTQEVDRAQLSRQNNIKLEKDN